MYWVIISWTRSGPSRKFQNFQYQQQIKPLRLTARWSQLLTCHTNLKMWSFISLYCGNPLRSLCFVSGKVKKQQILSTFIAFVVSTAIYRTIIICHICIWYIHSKPLYIQPFKCRHAHPASLWCGAQSKMAESDIGVLDPHGPTSSTNGESAPSTT